MNRQVETGKGQARLRQGFPPLVGAETRLLILGTFPGEASLAAGEYYAHPRNCFWEMMQVLCAAGRQLEYAQRCRVMTDAGIALWDVLLRCRREGSADNRIEGGGLTPNRLAEFLGQKRPRAIACNGQQAASLFKRLILPHCTSPCPPIVVLPSTSPANARMTVAQKHQAWQELTAWLDVYI